MSVRYPRYVMKENYRINGKDLSGAVVMDMGDCTAAGTKKVRGKKGPTKKQLTHKLFKFEFKKDLRDRGLSYDLLTFVMDNNHVPWFMVPQDEYNASKDKDKK